MCAGLTADDLALHLRVDASVFATELDRALQTACTEEAQITGTAPPDTGDDVPRWQTLILLSAAQLFAMREAPLGFAGGVNDLPMPVRAYNPQIEALRARLTVRAGLG